MDLGLPLFTVFNRSWFSVPRVARTSSTPGVVRCYDRVVMVESAEKMGVSAPISPTPLFSNFTPRSVVIWLGVAARPQGLANARGAPRPGGGGPSGGASGELTIRVCRAFKTDAGSEPIWRFYAAGAVQGRRDTSLRLGSDAHLPRELRNGRQSHLPDAAKTRLWRASLRLHEGCGARGQQPPRYGKLGQQLAQLQPNHLWLDAGHPRRIPSDCGGDALQGCWRQVGQTAP